MSDPSRELEGVAAPPRANGELVFAAPWESRVFGVTMALREAGVSFIRLATPTTDSARLPAVLEGSSGFLYYVSITGITGAASAKAADLKPHIDTIKNKTDLPVAIGFGVKTPENAAEMSTVADAVVVGSALVKTLNEEGIPALCKQVSALASALKT